MKKSIFGWIILGLVGLGVLLFVVSFRMIRSQSAANSEVASSRGDPAAKLALQPTPGLVVEGDGRLEKAIRAEITRLSKSQPELAQVNLLSTLEGAGNSPLLVVTVKQQTGFWTPVYARLALDVETAFATDGDISFRNSEPTHFVNIGSPAFVKYEGHYALSDVSWGIMSHPGYQDYLAHQIAVWVLTSLQEQLKA